MEFWHNPRCSKSREALALLRSRGVEPVVREYLLDPPSREALRALVGKLGLASARGLVRTGEELYRALELASANEDALIDALAAHPRLIERPILIHDNRAAVGRPPSAILDII